MAADLSPTLFTGQFLNAAARDGTRPSASLVLRSIKKQVDKNDWQTVVSISNRLYANMGLPKGAIGLKAILSVGEAWDPVYHGQDVEWGKKATDWLLEEFYPMANVRGPLYDFKTDTFLDSVSLDRGGDFFYLLTASDGGFPMVQAVPNHLIKSPVAIRPGMSLTFQMMVPRHLTNAGEGQGPVLRTVTASSVYNGVAYNQYGRPFAYCVYEESSEGLRDEPTQYKWVHEQYMIHTFDPEWYEQGRGFPAFTHAVRLFMSMLTSQEFEEITHMIMSSISLEEHNEEGLPNQSDPTTTIGSPLKTNLEANANGEIPQLVMEQIVGGVVKYFKSNTGAKVSTPIRSSPGPVWDAFQDRLARIALVGINMPSSIVWKGGDANGTSNRVDIEKVQRTVVDRQSLLSYPATRKIRYGIAVAMATGRLPRTKDWFSWGFSYPPEFRIDDGRYSKSDREDYVLGHQNLTGILARQGKRLMPHLLERGEEEAQRQIVAKQVTEKYAAEGVVVTPDMLGTVKAPGAPASASDSSAGTATPPDDATTAPAKPAKTGD